MKRTPLLIVLVVAVTTWVHAAFAGDDAPWWEQEKIRFMWGQWSRIEGDGQSFGEFGQESGVLCAAGLAGIGQSERDADDGADKSQCRDHPHDVA